MDNQQALEHGQKVAAENLQAGEEVSAPAPVAVPVSKKRAIKKK